MSDWLNNTTSADTPPGGRGEGRRLEWPPPSRLDSATRWISIWGVLAVTATVVTAVLLASVGPNEWAFWAGSISGLWPDLEYASGWVSLLAALMMVVGILLLTGYRSGRAPRGVYLACLLAGVAYMAAIAYAAVEGGNGFIGVLQYTVLPISYLADGGLDVGYAFRLVIFQLGVLAQLAWIAVFAAQTFRHRVHPVHPQTAASGTESVHKDERMTFTNAIRVVMSQKYATFSGRAGRAEYWWFTLFQNIVLGVLLLPMLPALEKGSSEAAVSQANTFLWMWIVAAILLVLPSLAVATRRLHDVGQNGQSGALLLLGFVPFGSIALLILLLQPTGPDNRYGRGHNLYNHAMPQPGFIASPAPVMTVRQAAHTSQPLVPAGWLTDPTDPSQFRYWDGSAWTESSFRPES